MSSSDFHDLNAEMQAGNFIGALQMVAQKKMLKLPEYKTEFKNDQNFTTTCVFENITDSADMPTKRASRQKAAKKVLETYLQLNHLKRDLSPPTNPAEQLGSSKDFISALQHYAVKRNMTQPLYEFQMSHGEAHNLTFTIRCTLGEHVEFGEGKSKRAAKKEAARLMWERVNEKSREQ